MHFNFGKECESCNLLRDLLEEERTNNRRLMDKLLSFSGAAQPSEVYNEASTPTPIKPKSWRMRKEMLEAEDRQRAKLMRESKVEVAPEQTVEELEKELGVESA